MPRPRFCRNPACPNASHPPPTKWLSRAGTYQTRAHGTVQRFVCRHCGAGMSEQSESMHYYAKRRLDLRQLFSRVRGGSSLRDIAREMGCSRTAVANAVLRLGRQAMAAQVAMMCGVDLGGSFVFDGLVSAIATRDYPSQIHTLVDRSTELVLAMTHCVTERGGTRSDAQRRRRAQRRSAWRPARGALSASIRLLVNELPRFADGHRIGIDTDENPLYTAAIDEDTAMRWYRRAGLLEHIRTPSTAARTTANRLFAVNYVDRMIRHRIKEHTRESIALGRSATMQMHRMWIFAWDHNVRQPHRVGQRGSRSRAIEAGASERQVARLVREFTTRRVSLRGLTVPESMRVVWLGELETPPLRWRSGRREAGHPIRRYARVDLSLARPAG